MWFKVQIDIQNRDIKKTPNQNNKNTNTIEKQTKNKPTSEEILKPIREIITSNQRNYPLSFKNVCILLDMAQTEKESNLLELTLQFTNRTDDLKIMINDIKEKTTNRSIKIRCTKILKSITKDMVDITTSFNESDSPMLEPILNETDTTLTY